MSCVRTDQEPWHGDKYGKTEDSIPRNMRIIATAAKCLIDPFVLVLLSSERRESFMAVTNS